MISPASCREVPRWLVDGSNSGIDRVVRVNPAHGGCCDDLPPRLWAAGDENGGHIGFSGGLWGAVLERVLLGAEVDADFILSVAYDGSVAQRVGFPLAIGTWI